MDQEKLAQLRKLAPFAVRSQTAETGRQRLLQHRNKLAFLLVTEDLSQNSLEEVFRDFPCPVYRALTMEDVAELFRFQGTKILGFRRGALSGEIRRCLHGCLVVPEDVTHTTMVPNPRVVLFGAGPEGMKHAAAWRQAGATVAGFLERSPEVLRTVAQALKDILGYEVPGNTDPEALLAAVEPHIVDVCLPTSLHYAGCHLALRLGFHVLCASPFLEKSEDVPRKSLLKQGDALVSLAARHKRLLAVADSPDAIPEFAGGNVLQCAAEEWRQLRRTLENPCLSSQ